MTTKAKSERQERHQELEQMADQALEPRFQAIEGQLAQLSSAAAPNVATPEQRKFLEERGWQEGRDIVMAEGRNIGGILFAGHEEMPGWLDMNPPPDRLEKTGELVIPTKPGHPPKIKEVHQIVCGGTAGRWHTLADALALEHRRNRKPLPLLEVFRTNLDCPGIRSYIYVRDRWRQKQFHLGHFQSVQQAEAFCKAAQQPGACSVCFEPPGERDTGPLREYVKLVPMLDEFSLRKALEEQWLRDWLAQRVVPLGKQPKPPAPPAEIEDIHEAGKQMDTIRVKRCQQCQQWPQRYGPPTAEEQTPAGVG